jgi:hypothetical protein
MWSLASLKTMKLFHRPGAFTVWRRSLRDSIGVFYDAYYAAGDKEYWGRITDRGIKYGLIQGKCWIPVLIQGTIPAIQS